MTLIPDSLRRRRDKMGAASNENAAALTLARVTPLAARQYGALDDDTRFELCLFLLGRMPPDLRVEVLAGCEDNDPLELALAATEREKDDGAVLLLILSTLAGLGGSVAADFTALHEAHGAEPGPARFVSVVRTVAPDMADAIEAGMAEREAAGE